MQAYEVLITLFKKAQQHFSSNRNDPEGRGINPLIRFKTYKKC